MSQSLQVFREVFDYFGKSKFTVFLWSVTLYVASSLAFKLPFVWTAEGNTPNILALLGILVTISIATTRFMVARNQQDKLRRESECSIYDLLAEVSDNLIHQYIEIVKFSGAVLNPESALDSLYTAVYPPAVTGSLMGIIKSENFFENENHQFKRRVSRVLSEVDLLNKITDDLSQTSKKLMHVSRTSIGKLIVETVAREPLLSFGVLSPQPVLFEIIQDLVGISVEWRKKAFSILMYIQNELNEVHLEMLMRGDTSTSRFRDSIKRQREFMELIAREDCSAPIRLRHLNLVNEINARIEKERVDRAKKAWGQGNQKRRLHAA
jgi:ABC-type multidrug transport system fused ATPase/permease subunit